MSQASTSKHVIIFIFNYVNLFHACNQQYLALWPTFLQWKGGWEHNFLPDAGWVYLHLIQEITKKFYRKFTYKHKFDVTIRPTLRGIFPQISCTTKYMLWQIRVTLQVATRQLEEFSWRDVYGIPILSLALWYNFDFYN